MPKRTTAHNYQATLQLLMETGEFTPDAIHEITVAHDGWCDIYRNGFCNCRPDFFLDGKKVTPPVA